jgi:hypothetical protein
MSVTVSQSRHCDGEFQADGARHVTDRGSQSNNRVSGTTDRHIFKQLGPCARRPARFTDALAATQVRRRARVAAWSAASAGPSGAAAAGVIFAVTLPVSCNPGLSAASVTDSRHERSAE